MFQDIKLRITEPEVGVIVSYAALDGSPEGVAKEASMYLSSDKLNFYGWVEDGGVVGICGFEVHADKVEIHLISVAEDRQKQGVGGAMVTALQRIYALPLEAETVEEAVGFYIKRGFVTTAFQDPEWGVKYTCVLEPKAGAGEGSRYEISQVDTLISEKIQSILVETWGSHYLAVNGKLWDSRTMPGFAAVWEGTVLGYLLYEYHSGVCEIMVLESVVQNIGIASALIEQLKQTSKSKGVNRIIVQTSNDNTHAFRFYQRRGFTIREVRLGALDAARQLKPSIPLTGEEGIPLRDEIEFEIEV